MSPEPVRQGADGALVEVRAQPGSSRDAVRAVTGGRLKIAVSAAPEKGGANAAVAGVLAVKLGVRRADVELVSGARSRDKTYLVRGLSAAEALGRLGLLS